MIQLASIAAALVLSQAQLNEPLKNLNITANVSSIFEVNNSTGRRVVTIELNGSVTIADGVSVDEAVEKTYELASFHGECTKDYTYTYEFDFIDKNHSGIGNWTVGLQPSGDVVYVGIKPTAVADSYFHKLAALAGRGVCHS